jgi:hypothetical protein
LAFEIEDGLDMGREGEVHGRKVEITQDCAFIDNTIGAHPRRIEARWDSNPRRAIG